MELVKKVRESAGLGPWAMYKLMKKKSVQAYLSLERNAKRITLADLVMLEQIWIDKDCGTAQDFKKLLRDEMHSK